MGIGLGAIGAGALGAGLGAAVGNMAGASGDTGAGDLLAQYNKLLNNALQNAMQSINSGTNNAIGAQNTGLNASTSALTGGYNTALQQLLSGTNGGFNLGQALETPYRNAGYNSTDALSASLGLATPQGGSVNQANQAAGQAQAQLYGQQIFGQGGVPTGSQLLTAPTAPTAYNPMSASQSQVSPQQIDQFLNDPSSAGTLSGMGLSMQQVNNPTVARQYAQQYLAQQQAQNANQSGQSQFQNAQQQYQTQQQAYQTQQQQLQQYNNQLQQIGYNPQNANSPSNGSNTNSQSDNSQSNQSGLQQFLNSPQYQAMFGTQQGQNLAAGGQYNPLTAFQQDPGTQFAIDQATKAINQNAASKGLASSGGNQQAIADYITGLENQKYTAYQNQVGSTFTNYQNNLQQLTNLGSGLTGANTAASLYSNLGNNASNAALGTAQGVSNANLNTADNISSLYSNQGTSNANLYSSTGAAQASGLLNVAGMNAQAMAAQQASNAQTYGANASNQGAQSALNMIMPYLQQSSTSNNQNLFGGSSSNASGRTGGSF